MSERPFVLIVEDEWYLKADLEQALNDAGFAAETASSGEEALTLFLGDTKKYKVLITDVRLQGVLYGWDVARHRAFNAVKARLLQCRWIGEGSREQVAAASAEPMPPEKGLSHADRSLGGAAAN